MGCEVRRGDWLVVDEDNLLDAGEDDVLRDLGAEAAEAEQEDLGLGHPRHGLAAVDGKLPRMEVLINGGGRGHGA